MEIVNVFNAKKVINYKMAYVNKFLRRKPVNGMNCLNINQYHYAESVQLDILYGKINVM